MKLDPHLPQLPSIGELLEHPRVKGVVARINRSTLAHRAAGFLDELKSSLAGRTGRVEMPSVTQLAERLARRLLGEPPASGPVINATGLVVGDPDLAPPLPDAAVHAMMQVASEYHDRGAELRAAMQREFCGLAGAEAALVLNSFDSALNVVIATAAASREMLVCGSPTPSVGGIDWRRLAARHSVLLRASAADPTSLAAAAKDGAALGMVMRSPDAEGLASTYEIAAVAKNCGAGFIDAAPFAGLLNPREHGLQSLESIGERLAAGADLVIADGAGLLGGPACGIIVGKRSLVDAAAAHHLSSIAAMDVVRAAAMQSTLAIYRDDQEGSAKFSIPVWQLLSAPLANLEQRAQRLAALIAAGSEIASAEARQIESPWRRYGELAVTAPTWVIAVRLRTGDAESVLSRLRQQGPHPLLASAAEDAVHLDLRSVFPRCDQQLVAAFEGTGG